MKLRILVLLACAALFASSCAKKEGETTAGMGAAASGSAANGKADSMKAAYKAISDAWDAGTPDVFDKYVAANSVDHDPMPGQKPGVEGMKEMAKMMKTAFPDMKSTIELQSVDGDILTVRFKVSGTNSGPMMGMPATNKKMDAVSGFDQMRWENGKFVEHWGVFDAAKMMMQLGMMPPSGGAPTADMGKEMKKDEMKKK